MESKFPVSDLLVFLVKRWFLDFIGYGQSNTLFFGTSSLSHFNSVIVPEDIQYFKPCLITISWNCHRVNSETLAALKSQEKNVLFFCWHNNETVSCYFSCQITRIKVYFNHDFGPPLVGGSLRFTSALCCLHFDLELVIFRCTWTIAVSLDIHLYSLYGISRALRHISFKFSLKVWTHKELICLVALFGSACCNR